METKPKLEPIWAFYKSVTKIHKSSQILPVYDGVHKRHRKFVMDQWISCSVGLIASSHLWVLRVKMASQSAHISFSLVQPSICDALFQRIQWQRRFIKIPPRTRHTPTIITTSAASVHTNNPPGKSGSHSSPGKLQDPNRAVVLMERKYSGTSIG